MPQNTTVNRRIVLNARPRGAPTAEDFRLEQAPVPEPESGQVDDLPGHLAAACPKGIDIYLENVGGALFDAVLPLLNTRARVPVCGLIAAYNATELPPGSRMSEVWMSLATGPAHTTHGTPCTGAPGPAGGTRHRPAVALQGDRSQRSA